MSRIVAVFDLDNTLVAGRTELLFFRDLVRQRRLSPARTLAFLMRLAAKPSARFRDKSYLQGLEVADTLEVARRCYREAIRPRLRPGGLACIREHQVRGHAIVILTGSLDFLVQPLLVELRADWLLATQVARQDRCFTGEISGLHPRGENKSLLLRRLAGEQDLDLSSSFAYGDHHQDYALFRQVGHPVAVNPSWRLRRLARKHRWEIRSFAGAG